MAALISDRAGTRKLGLLSVVAPVYNEELLIGEFYARVCGALDGLNWELVLVDDGSSDSTRSSSSGSPPRTTA